MGLRAAGSWGKTRAIHAPRPSGSLRLSGWDSCRSANPSGGSHPPPTAETQNALGTGVSGYVTRGDRLGPSMALALRAACGCPDRLSCRSANPAGVLIRHRPQKRKTPWDGRFGMRDAGGMDSDHPWPSPFGQPSAVRIGSCRSANPAGVLIRPLPRYANAPMRGRWRIWRRGGDSNPRGAINACLISSQVHSTTLPPLRKAWGRWCGQGAE